MHTRFFRCLPYPSTTSTPSVRADSSPWKGNKLLHRPGPYCCRARIAAVRCFTESCTAVDTLTLLDLRVGMRQKEVTPAAKVSGRLEAFLPLQYAAARRVGFSDRQRVLTLEGTHGRRCGSPIAPSRALGRLSRQRRCLSACCPCVRCCPLLFLKQAVHSKLAAVRKCPFLSFPQAIVGKITHLTASVDRAQRSHGTPPRTCARGEQTGCTGAAPRPQLL